MATEKLKYLVTADTKGFVTPMKGAAALVTAAFVASIKVTAEFEKELSKLKAISGATAKDMEALEKDARNLGKSTAFTATEVATLQTELAKLGFTTNDILNSSGGVLDLAAGLGSTLGDAAVLTGSTLRAFGLTTEETGRVVDVLALSASSSALDFNKLTESLKTAAPIAKAANISFEDTVALLGTLANAGIHGSLAGTALRQIFIELNSKGLSLNEAFKQVNDSSNKLAAAKELVGKRAASALLVLAEGIQPTNDLADALRNADGAAQEMRTTMEDNLIGDFAKLKSAVTELGITLGQILDGPLRAVVQWMTDFINGTEEQLGFLDSLNKAWLTFYETMLLAGRAAELTYQALIVNNPFGSKLIPKESIDRLMMFNEELAKVNERIIDLTLGGTTTKKGGSKTNTNSTTNNNNPTTPTSGLAVLSGGLGGFSNSNPFTALSEGANKTLKDLQGAFTEMELAYSKFVLSVNEKSIKTSESISQGWKVAGAAIASAIGTAIGSGDGFENLGATLLKTLGGLLVSIGTAALLANTALKVFGIEISTGAAIAAIAFGSILGAVGSRSPGSSEAGSSASSTGSSSISPDVRSLQGGGSGSRNVGGLSTSDGNIIFPADLLRQAMQASDRKYNSLAG